MLIKAYELFPAMSTRTVLARNGDVVRRVYDAGTPGENYTFIIGTRGNLPERTRNKIRNTFEQYWGELFNEEELRAIHKRKFRAPPYGVTFVPDSSPPTGENVLPTLFGKRFFIVFLLLESNSGTTELGEEGITREMGNAIAEQFKHQEEKPRVAVIALYNCSIELMRSPGDSFIDPSNDGTEYSPAEIFRPRKRNRR